MHVLACQIPNTDSVHKSGMSAGFSGCQAMLSQWVSTRSELPLLNTSDLLTVAMQIIPLSSAPASAAVQAHALDLSPAPSNAEQSLLAHGLSSVYDPNQEAEEHVSKRAADTSAIIALSVTPSEAVDNR